MKRTILSLWLLFMAFQSLAIIRYVKPAKSGNGNGLSWANASDDLQDMINKSVANDLIYVAAGVYYPNRKANATGTISLNNRDNAFVMKGQVYIYGGFGGYESSHLNRSSRSVYNSTILSGNIGAKDKDTDNAYHVVVAAGTGLGSFDRVDIESGNANGTGSITVNDQTVKQSMGGGIAIQNAGPSFYDMKITYNKATSGGGVYHALSTANYSECSIANNTATSLGGGMYVDSGSPSILNSYIRSNKATGNGGGIYVAANAGTNLNRAKIFDNSTPGNGGGVYLNSAGNSTQLSTVYFDNVSNAEGGGLYVNGMATNASLKLINCTLIKNTASSGQAISALNRQNIILQNTIVWKNKNYTANDNLKEVNGSYVVSNSILQYPGNGYNISGTYKTNDPFEAYSGQSDFRISEFGLAVNSGNNSFYPYLSATTLDANENDNFRLQQGTIDIGAYESSYNIQRSPDASGILYVKTNSSGTKVGNNWTNALTTLGDAIEVAKRNSAVKQIWVAKGTYYPKYGINSSNDYNDNVFSLVKDVKIYGGFAGTETALSQRNLSGVNATVLSGDVKNDDQFIFDNSTQKQVLNNTIDNNYIVVYSEGNIGSAELSDFTISGASKWTSKGGGVYISGSSPILRNLIIKNNYTGYGAAIYATLTSSAPKIVNCLLTGNIAYYGGTAIAVENGAKAMVINSTIVNHLSNLPLFYKATNGDVILYNSIVHSNTYGTNISNLNNNVNAKFSLTQGVFVSNQGNQNSDLISADGLFTDRANNNYSLKAGNIANGLGDKVVYESTLGVSLATELDLIGNKRLQFSKLDVGAYAYPIDKGIIADGNGVVYVKKGGAGNSKGSSWTNAASELGDALLSAKHNTAIKQIWVAKGTYNPLFNINDDAVAKAKDNAFNLVKDVKIYGGFAGTETTLASRVLNGTNATVLSGDYNNDDVLTVSGTPAIQSITNNSENATIVVRSAGDVGTAELNNLTISSASNSGLGGGIYINKSSPRFNSIIVEKNRASHGAGAFIDGASSSPKFFNSIFRSNIAAGNGSAIGNDNGAKTKLINCTIVNHLNNKTLFFNGSTEPVFINSVIVGNTFSPNITNWGTGINATYSLTQGATVEGGNNIDANGMNPSVIFTSPNTADYSLILGSKAIGMGNNSSYQTENGNIAPNSEKDIIGNIRLFGATIDAGAYERPTASAQTITVSDVVKVYGDASFAPTASTNSGLPLTIVSADNTIAEAIKDASSSNGYIIKIKKVGSVNFTVSQAGGYGYNAANNKILKLIINPKAVNVSIKPTADVTKVYNGNVNGNITVVDLNIATADIISGDVVALSLSSTAITYDNKNAGDAKTIELAKANVSLTGASASNYVIGNTTNITASIGKITTAALSIKAKDQSKIYDGNVFSDYSVTTTGFVGGDDINTLTGTLNYAGTAITAVNGGSYTIIPSGLSAVNYNITYVNGKLDILPVAANTLSFSKQSDGSTLIRTYGDETIDAVASSTSGLPLTYSSSDPTIASVSNGIISILKPGTTTITVADNGNNNYNAATPISLTVQVNKKDLLVTAKSQVIFETKPAKANEVIYTGFITGETESVLGGLLVYGGTWIGEIAVGTYTIIPSGLSSDNYNFNYVNGTLKIIPIGSNELSFNTHTSESTVNVNYGTATVDASAIASSGLMPTYESSDLSVATVNTDGLVTIIKAGETTITASQNGNETFGKASPIYFKLKINKQPLTITAISDNKVYDGIAYTTNKGVTYSGFVNNETENVLSGDLVYNGTWSGAKDAKNYIIQPTGLISDNYAINYVNGTLSIFATPLYITVHPISKIYGETDPALTYTVDGLVGTETLTGGLERAPGEDVGTYLISRGSLVATSNYYIIPFKSGDFVIKNASLAGVSFDKNSVAYNGQGQIIELTGNLPVGFTVAYTNNTHTNAGTYEAIATITSSNLEITVLKADLEIMKAPLTITANDASTTYNSVQFAGGNDVTITGFVNGETSTVLGGNVVYGGDAQGAINVGAYTLVPSGFTSNNYNISYVNGQLNIAKATLIVSAESKTKVYGSVDPIFTYTSSGLIGADELSGNLERTLGEDTNTYSINLGTVSAGGNYDITYTSADLIITQASLTIAASNLSTNYRGVAFSGGNGVTYDGFVNNDEASALAGTLVYGGDAQGAIATGNYTIEPSGLTSANYSITFKNGNLEINQAPLSVTANSYSKVYDGIAYLDGTGVTYSGFVNNENESVLTGTLAYSGTALGAKEAGGYLITPSGLNSSNYVINYVNGNVDINKAPLEIIADNHSIVYNGNAYSGGNGVNYTGFVNNENESVLTGVLAFLGTSQGATQVGNYVIEPSGLVSNNYNINFKNGLLEITKNTSNVLSFNTIVGGSTINKTYGDGTLDASAVASSGLAVSYSSSDPSVATVDAATGLVTILTVGSTQIVASQLGDANHNPATSISVDLVVAKKALVVKAKDLVKSYDGIAYTGSNGLDYTGFVNSENEAVLGGTLIFGGTSQNAVTVGSYVITPSGLTSANYELTFDNGNLEITPAQLTVTAQDYNKFYDGTAYANGNGVIYTGFVNNENESALTGAVAFTGTAQGAKDVGNYALTPSGLFSSNYNIVYADGKLEIKKATLEISANNNTIEYTGNAYSGGNGISYTGFVNGENELVLSGAINYSGTSQGATEAGSYVITPNGLSSTNYEITYKNGLLEITRSTSNVLSFNTLTSGATINKTYGDGILNGSAVASSGLAVNYSSSNPSVATIDATTGQVTILAVGTSQIIASQVGSSNYIPATPITVDLVVNKKILNVQANNQTKIYDGVAYTANNGVVISGFVNNEDASVLSNSVVTYSGTAQGAITTGSYEIIPSGLTAANYDFDYKNGILSIVATGSNVITFNHQVAGANQTVIYGAANIDASAISTAPLPVTYASSNTAVASVDVMGIVKIHTVGTATITANQAGDTNYAPATSVSFDVMVQKKSLIISANNDAKVYDAVNYSGGKGVTYNGFINNEDQAVLQGTLTYTGNAQGAKAVGSYFVTPAGLTADNYAIAYNDGTLTVTKAPLKVTANAMNKNFGDADPNFTYSVVGLLGNDALSGSLSRVTGENVGTYAINLGTLSAGGNYDLTYIAADLNIAQSGAITIALNNQNFAYNGLVQSLALTGTLPLGTSVAFTNNARTDVGTHEVTATITGTNFQTLTLKANITITPVALTVTANNQTKIYDGLAYSGNNSVSYSGFVNNESATVLTGALSFTGTSSNNATNAGSYSIIPAGLTSNNYVINYVDGSLEVTKRGITITATSQSKTYGDTDPILTYVSNSNLISGDSFSGLLSRVAGENAGSYVIRQGSLKINNNYDVVFVDGTLTIAKAILNISVANASICWGEKLPAYTITYEGFKFNDVEANLSNKAIATSPVDNKKAGNYPVTVSGANSINYTFNYLNGNIVVNALPVAVITSDKGVSISKGETITLTADGGTVVSWADDKGVIAGQTGLTLTVRPIENTVYTLVVSNASGCTSTQSINITLNDNYEVLKATNILTPNGDGINDKFVIDNIDMYPDHELKIFDRNGNILFTKKGYDNTWDGKINGRDLSLGTYYYIISYGEGKHKQKGFITIVRNN